MTEHTEHVLGGVGEENVVGPGEIAVFEFLPHRGVSCAVVGLRFSADVARRFSLMGLNVDGKEVVRGDDFRLFNDMTYAIRALRVQIPQVETKTRVILAPVRGASLRVRNDSETAYPFLATLLIEVRR